MLLGPPLVAKLEEMERGAAATSQEGLAEWLDELRCAREEINTTFDVIETELIRKRKRQYPRGGVPALHVEGLHGPVEFHRASSRTQWRKKELIPVVVARIIDEPGVVWDSDGERLPVVESALRIAGRLGDCIGWGAPKVTGLRAIGLEPSEWCDEKWGALQVQLPERIH